MESTTHNNHNNFFGASSDDTGGLFIPSKTTPPDGNDSLHRQDHDRSNWWDIAENNDSIVNRRCIFHHGDPMNHRIPNNTNRRLLAEIIQEVLIDITPDEAEDVYHDPVVVSNSANMDHQ
jgi:hypothetical protein